jgi:glycosyltransferase involved in cell wall biosynthesis
VIGCTENNQTDMRIVQLTPGAGENFYCENCLRDHAVVRQLQRDGHDVLMVPMYLPSISEFHTQSDLPVFFGGINVYLQQKFSLFRKTPRWLDRMLDSPTLLRAAGAMSGMTRAKDLGETTVSMLEGEQGAQTKEIDRLVDFLADQPAPDVVALSNIMLGGLTRRLQEELGVPVVATCQDEDAFLDSLPEPYNSRAWELLCQRARQLDGLIVTSEYYRGVMAERLGMPADAFEVVPNGIDPEGYAPPQSPPDPPRIGYLSPLSYDKGLDQLLDAFLVLRKEEGLEHLQLELSGGVLASQKSFMKGVHRRLAKEGVDEAVRIHDEFDRAAKARFLPKLTVLSVPTRKPEASGLYILEALACGVPVVQPRHGAFPEVLETTGGGLLFEPNDVDDLTAQLRTVLIDPTHRALLAGKGRAAVLNNFTMAETAPRLVDAFQTFIDRTRS